MATYYHDSKNGLDTNSGLIGFPVKTLTKGASLLTVVGDILLSTNDDAGPEVLTAGVVFPTTRHEWWGCDASFNKLGAVYKFDGNSTIVTGVTHNGTGSVQLGIQGQRCTARDFLCNSDTVSILCESLNSGGVGFRTASNFGLLLLCSVINPATKALNNAGLGWVIDGCYLEAGTTSVSDATRGTIFRNNVFNGLTTEPGATVSSQAVQFLNNLFINCTDAISKATAVEVLVKMNRFVDCTNGIVSTGGSVIRKDNAYYNTTQTSYASTSDIDLGGETVLTASGVIGGGDFGTSGTAERLSVEELIGAGITDYGSTYKDVGLQALIEGGGSASSTSFSDSSASSASFSDSLVSDSSDSSASFSDSAVSESSDSSASFSDSSASFQAGSGSNSSQSSRSQSSSSVSASNSSNSSSSNSSSSAGADDKVSIEARVEASLCSAISGIKKINGFNYDVEVCELQRLILEFGGRFDYVMIVKETPEKDNDHRIIQKLIYTVWFFTDQNYEKIEQDVILDVNSEIAHYYRNVDADIARAVNLDITRGGLVTLTEYIPLGFSTWIDDATAYFGNVGRIEVMCNIDATNPYRISQLGG